MPHLHIRDPEINQREQVPWALPGREPAQGRAAAVGSSGSGMGWMLLLTLLFDQGVPARTPSALWLISFFHKEGMGILTFN